MDAATIRQQVLFDKLRDAILEAARSQVPVGIILAALDQASKDVRAALPIVIAYKQNDCSESGKGAIPEVSLPQVAE